MDEGLESRFLEMMKAILTTAKIEGPITYRKTVNEMLKDYAVRKEENKSKNKDETGLTCGT